MTDTLGGLYILVYRKPHWLYMDWKSTFIMNIRPFVLGYKRIQFLSQYTLLLPIEIWHQTAHRFRLLSVLYTKQHERLLKRMLRNAQIAEWLNLILGRIIQHVKHTLYLFLRIMFKSACSGQGRKQPPLTGYGSGRTIISPLSMEVEVPLIRSVDAWSLRKVSVLAALASSSDPACEAGLMRCILGDEEGLDCFGNKLYFGLFTRAGGFGWSSS